MDEASTPPTSSTLNILSRADYNEEGQVWHSPKCQNVTTRSEVIPATVLLATLMDSSVDEWEHCAPGRSPPRCRRDQVQTFKLIMNISGGLDTVLLERR